MRNQRSKNSRAAALAEVHFVEPMYARQVQTIPAGKDWIYEVKLDGYRCLMGRDSAGVTLWSRRGNDFTEQFPHIAAAGMRLPPGTLVDGEIVALDADGRISFNILQHHRPQAQALLYYIFDLIICAGQSAAALPLEKRRGLLSDLSLAGHAGPLALTEYTDGEPATLLNVVREFDFEGIIAKRKDSCYESGKRSGAWVKHKINRGQEFVIGGYTGGTPLDALIVGYLSAANSYMPAR
jgi:bifunctional non-homologous end joining protein LigD